MIECIQRLITSIAERVGTQGAAKESLGTVPASLSTTMVSEGTFSGGAKVFGWSVSLSRTEKFGEIKILEEVVESPLRKLSRILR